MKRKPYLCKFNVTPYYSDLSLSVSHDIKSAVERAFPGIQMPSDEGDTDWLGYCAWQGKTFGIFFNYEVNHGSIAHELFHVTHRILDASHVIFTTTNHEPFTYLHQALTDTVYRSLKQAKIRVHL